MIMLYILAIAYIGAINFYAFLLVKSLKQQTNEQEVLRQSAPLVQEPSKPERYLGKLLITGALGGAIAVYVSMFVMRYKRGDLLLMVLMPLLGVLNVYGFITLFRSGFSFLLVR